MLIEAILALFVLPALVMLFRRVEPVQDVIDGMVLTTVTAVLFLEVLPHALSASPGIGVLGFLLGFGLPMLAERTLAKARGVGLLLAVLLFSAHSVLDGVILQTAQTESVHAAVILVSNPV